MKMAMKKQKITPFLWFDKGKAKEAAEFYVSVFKNAKIKHSQIMENTPSGNVEIISIELFGQNFTLMSAGPEFKFSEAISFVVSCKNQEEIDYYWEKLSAVPESEQCGWVKDKFGLSWQIIPENMGELMSRDPEKTTPAMLKMKKIVIKDLETAGEEK